MNKRHLFYKIIFIFVATIGLSTTACALFEPAVGGPGAAGGAAEEAVDAPPPVETEEPLPVPTSTPTSTPAGPSVGSALVSEQDGMTMVYVPAGEFKMGSNADDSLAECQKFRDDCAHDWYIDEEPVHLVNLDAFWIDQTEVTNAMFARCVEAGACKPPLKTRSHTQESYYGDPELDNYPVIYVSWYQANAYCEWVGRRLPSEAEWEKAAGWDETAQVHRLYPWGDTFDGNLVNFCDANCPLDWKSSEFDDGYADTAPVGSYPGVTSYYGKLDMAGNVWEWVGDWYEGDYYSELPVSNPTDPSAGAEKVQRGGAWYLEEDLLRTAFRSKHTPIDADSYVGFRCAMSEAP